MRHFKLYSSLLLLIFGFSTLKADELNLSQDFSRSEELISRQLSNNNKQSKRIQTKRAVYFSSTQAFQAKKSLFFQTNIGVGFLYFSGVRGNLMGQPVLNFNPSREWRDAPMKGRLKYNRTPLFEYILGYQCAPWLKLALSYQYQGGISIRTKTLPGSPIFASDSDGIQFISNLNLNALLFKLYFELPYALVLKKMAISPYLAAGVGPGWQSWTRIQVPYLYGHFANISEPLSLRQKISANAVWMLDLGFKAQSSQSNRNFSVLLGCKYNQWGQARSIGKMSQQGANKIAITQPLRIKTVYQFAPYLGVQWDFPDSFSSNPSYTLKGKNPNVWLPYWASTRSFQSPKSLWTEFNAGVGFLYFSGVRGNLMGEPILNFDPQSGWRDVPLTGSFSYNRTPLFEYLLGYKCASWLKIALSYQYQGEIAIQSKFIRSQFVGSFRGDMVQFSSNLSLNSILFKLYFELPYALIFKNLSISPYLAVGVGPGWQSWARIQVNKVDSNSSDFTSKFLPLRQKISANAVWMLDLGFRTQSSHPKSSFSVLLGCKYNQWGQARSIGKMTQQGAHKLALTQPIRIKTVYQFAPYLGVQWSFPNTFSSQSSYVLKGKSPNIWLPYFTKANTFQCPKGLWTQFNAGIGFLYFSGVRANLMGEPTSQFTPSTSWRDVPLKGRFSYNRTPLFDYLLGYSCASWLKIALSYQHQGGITIRTKALIAFPNSNFSNSEVTQFTSDLSLDALLAKLYFELPYALVFKNLSTSLYLAAGVGPGWQTWRHVEVNYMNDNTTFFASPLPLRQKISANAVWMLDLGFRIQSAYQNSKFSVLLGCKYNQWGQARSIGKMTQQGSSKFAISKPLRIKTVYQFAPYLGVQWNF